MDEDEIRERYFDDSKLTKGSASLVRAGDKVIAGVDDRKDVFEMTARRRMC
ncbi:hypothetical protein [Sedimentitalea sp.]|uniref:hypothetical protein n=1 Tax=Sedimentitalea sp. TaxID=2048915 RepID=UPI0032990351